MNQYKLAPQDISIEYWSSKPASAWSLNQPRGVKITHLKTGLVVTEESERSQHKNKQIALERLREMLDAAPDVGGEENAIQHLWESLGRWSAYLASEGGNANLSPPQWLIDAVSNATNRAKAPDVGGEAVACPACGHTNTYCGECGTGITTHGGLVAAKRIAELEKDKARLLEAFKYALDECKSLGKDVRNFGMDYDYEEIFEDELKLLAEMEKTK